MYACKLFVNLFFFFSVPKGSNGFNVNTSIWVSLTSVVYFCDIFNKPYWTVEWMNDWMNTKYWQTQTKKTKYPAGQAVRLSPSLTKLQSCLFKPRKKSLKTACVWFILGIFVFFSVWELFHKAIQYLKIKTLFKKTQDFWMIKMSLLII